MQSGALRSGPEESLPQSFLELSLGNSRFRSSMGMVEMEISARRGYGCDWRSQGSNGFGIGFAFEEELTNGLHKESDITRNDEKNVNQKDELNMKDPDWSPQAIWHSGYRKSRQKFTRRGKKSLENVSEGNLMDTQEEIRNMAASNSIKELLLNSGWMVVSRQGLGEAVYVSPSGSVYGSLAKALEAFSQDMSRPTAKGWSFSPLNDSGGLKRNNVSSAPDFGSKKCLVSRDLVKSIQKKKGKKESSSKRKKVLVEVGPIGGTLLTEKNMVLERKQELDEGLATESLTHEDAALCMVDKKLKHCGTKISDCTMSEDVNINESNISDFPRNVGNRRSARINGRHVPVHYDLDIEMEGNEDSYLDSFKWAVADFSLRPQEVESRKEVHGGAVTGTVDHKKVNSCIDQRCSSHETKSSGCSRGEVVSKKSDCYRMYVTVEGSCKSNVHQDSKLIGVRRSSRINGRHVPVDGDFDLIMEADSYCLGSSRCVSYRMTKKDMVTSINHTSKIKNMEGRLPLDVKKLTKETGRKKYNCTKREHKKELGNGRLPSWDGTKLKKGDGIRIDKCSPPKTNRGKPLLEKSSPSTLSKRKSVGGGNSNGKKKKKRSGGCALIVRRLGKDDHEEKLLSETKACILSWLIDAGALTENEKVVYKNKKCRIILKGWVARGGVRCNCCKKVVSLKAFEAHAGCNLRQPWDNAHVGSKSLVQCLVEAWEKEKKQRKVGFQTVGVSDPDPSDDTCGVCADGGSLICCDGCPSTFHQDCVMLKVLPEGSWCCPYCRCAFCMMAKLGEDKTEGSFMLLTCSQCGSRYHRECAWGHEMLMGGSESLSFCGKYCQKVAINLLDMLGVANPTGGGFSWTLLRRLDEDHGFSLDKGPSFIMESNAKLALSLSVLEECFVPLLDQRSGLDLLSQAVYNCGSNYSRLNYERFHTMVLEKDEEIISVATLRIHGKRLAEMPFIGTRPIYRRQGMCRRLLKAVEDMLSSLRVEKLIIPAIPDLLETWMKSFSFKPLESSHREEIRNLNMIILAETTLLQKSICDVEMEDEGDNLLPLLQTMTSYGGHSNPGAIKSFCAADN